MKKKINIFLKRYGYYGALKHLLYFLNTKFFYSKSRMIRLPIEIRGRHLIDFGEKLTTGSYCRIEAVVKEDDKIVFQKQIKIGNNVIMNDNVHIGALHLITIGNNVLIGSKVLITDHYHGFYSGRNQSSPLIPPNQRMLGGLPVIIEDDVWIGEFVSVLPGVTIGKGCIIGTQSVVNKSIPAYSMAVGSPAKIIKQYNFETKQWESVKINAL